MTITVRVTTGPHTAQVSVGGNSPVTIGPDADQSFYAYDGADVLVHEVSAGVVTADSGDNGPRPGKG